MNRYHVSFLKKAKDRHGDKFLYDRIKWVNSTTKIEIGCPIHGYYWQTPSTHLTTSGCKKCGYAKSSEKLSKGRDTFIKEAMQIHGDHYTYTNVVYKTNDKPVEITCPIHGPFKQTPITHLRGSGCPVCGHIQSSVKQISDVDEWINKARAVHGDKYDYTNTIYKGAAHKLSIVCPTHGVFEQTATNHLSGQGCRACGIETIRANQTSTLNEFLIKANTVHNEKYTYDKVVAYNGNLGMLTITCPEHGDFQQRPQHHLRGNGCPICRYESSSEKLTYSWDTFVNLSNVVHDNKFTYPLQEYTNTSSNVVIDCPAHGEFIQTASVHLRGHGCPRCSNHISTPENEIFEYLVNTDDGWSRSDRKIINGKEIDIINHDKKIGVEYCGLYWHSNKFRDNNYHIDKLNQMELQGYRLITIFEDEWLNRPDVVKSRINHIAGNNTKTIGARKLRIESISWPDAKQFLNIYHLQGRGSAGGVYVGAFHETELVAVMTLGKRSVGVGNHQWELMRMCSDHGSYTGVFNRLFKYAVNTYQIDEVVSYADRRWSQGGIYEAMGFTSLGVTTPNYWVFTTGKPTIRSHRYTYRKDRMIQKFGSDPALTGKQMQNQLGLLRIYDCGSHRYQWVRNS